MALLPARNILDGTKSPATTTSDMKTALGSIRDYLAGLLGTDSSNLAAARTALDAGQGVYGSRGLIGAVDVTTPLTKYSLSADAVVLRNATGGTVTRYSVAASVCDLGLAGPAVTGRDQAAAFTAGSWVYLYFIWNGTYTTTIASASPPPSGPTLPATYTHWCFATALRWNASSNIVPCRTQGSTVWYDLATGGVNRVQSSGVATTMTTVGCSGFAPPIAAQASLFVLLNYTHNAVAEFTVSLRPSGASNAGQVVLDAVTEVANQTNSANVIIPFFLGTSSNIEYKLNTSPSTAGGVYIDVLGFTLPNGG